MILLSCAAKKLNDKSNRIYQVGTDDNNDHFMLENNDDNDVQIDLSGQYKIILSNKIIEEMYSESTVHVKWHTHDKEKRNNEKCVLNRALVKCLHRHITQNEDNVSKVQADKPCGSSTPRTDGLTVISYVRNVLHILLLCRCYYLC
jgi:hypothetical protein